MKISMSPKRKTKTTTPTRIQHAESQNRPQREPRPCPGSRLGNVDKRGRRGDSTEPEPGSSTSVAPFVGGDVAIRPLPQPDPVPYPRFFNPISDDRTQHRKSRIRLRQVGGDARGDGPDAVHRPGERRRACVRRRRPADDDAGAAPPHRRQGHGDDLPGADVVAEPVLHRRLPDRRGAEGASRPRPPRRAPSAPSSCWREVGIPDPERARCAPSRTSCPAA